METKVKAKKLIEIFTLYLGNDNSGKEFYVDELEAKQCALICVNEIIQGIYSMENYDSELNLIDINYWKEVKKELNNDEHS